MKNLISGIVLLALSSMCQAASFETSGGIGAVVPDSELVESAVIGKVDNQFNLNSVLSLGLSVSQTGNFKQESKPYEVKHAEANPSAFAATTFHNTHNGVVIVENDNTDITNIQVYDSPDSLPKKPTDNTERNFWSAEPYVQLGLPIALKSGKTYTYLRPYVRAFLGGSGVKTAGGESLIGLSKGLGGGVSLYLTHIILSLEANRRYIDAGKATYGNFSYFAKAGWAF